MTALSPPKHPVGLAWLGTQHRRPPRYLGAGGLATGVAHIEQYAVVAIAAEVAATCSSRLPAREQKIRATSR